MKLPIKKPLADHSDGKTRVMVLNFRTCADCYRDVLKLFSRNRWTRAIARQTWIDVTYFGTEHVSGHLTDDGQFVQGGPVHESFSGDEYQIRRFVLEYGP